MFIKEAFELIAPNLDSFGLIVHKGDSDGGGGDTPQRVGMFFYALTFLPDFTANAPLCKFCFLSMLSKLERRPGIYIRHPLPGSWTNSENVLSRDQTIPLVISMGVYGLSRRLWNLTWAYVKRLGFAQNTHGNHGEKSWKIPDLMWAPHHLAMWLRAWMMIYPMLKILAFPLMLLDLAFPVASIIGVIKGRRNPEHSDDLNYQLLLLQAQQVCPTPPAYLGRLIYSRFRTPPAAAHHPWGPAACLEKYFWPQGAPNFFDLYVGSHILDRIAE